MEDTRKAVADKDGSRQRLRRTRDAAAVYDTATSGRSRTTTAGGNGNLQELPRVTAATTPTVGLPPGASSQFSGAPGRGGGSQWRPPTTMLQPPLGDPALGRGGGSAPPPFLAAHGRGRGLGLGGSYQSQGRLPTPMFQPPLGTALGRGVAGAGQPSSSRGRAPGCSSCGAPATRVALKMPMCEACYRDTFLANAPPQHAQMGYAGAPRGAVAVPAPLHNLAKPAPPPERQSSSRAREQQVQVELEALDAMRLQVANILNNPFSAVRCSPANLAPERQSSSPGCYSNLFTGSGPLFSNAGARAPQAQGHGTAIDQQRQLDLLRDQPSSSQARPRAPGCSSCGGPATRVALKMPMCEACYRDMFMANAPPQHARIGPPPLHTLAKPAPPPERQSSSRAREQQDAMRLQVANILNNLSAVAPPQHAQISNAGTPQGRQQFRDSGAPVGDSVSIQSLATTSRRRFLASRQHGGAPQGQGNGPPQHPSPAVSYAGAVRSNEEQNRETLPAGNVSPSPVPSPSNAGAPQGQQQYRDSVVELLAATEPSRAGSQRAAYSNCEACRFSGDKACMFCHNPGPPPPPPGQS